jgi:EAL domain-containing protein (putative c-di-GMP-specific phosphodiesterase class I)
MDDPQRAFHLLCRRKDKGIPMAKEDFGTGYFS